MAEVRHRRVGDVREGRAGDPSELQYRVDTKYRGRGLEETKHRDVLTEGHRVVGSGFAQARGPSDLLRQLEGDPSALGCLTSGDASATALEQLPREGRECAGSHSRSQVVVGCASRREVTQGGETIDSYRRVWVVEPPLHPFTLVRVHNATVTSRTHTAAARCPNIRASSDHRSAEHASHETSRRPSSCSRLTEPAIRDTPASLLWGAQSGAFSAPAPGDCTVSLIARGRAFMWDLRRGHFELETEACRRGRVAAVFTELA